MILKKKPELLVAAKNLEELVLLINAGADAILIGGGNYGLRARGNYDLDMIRESTIIAHKSNVKIYVMMNALLHNGLLGGLEEYIKEITAFNVDAILFEDPAVYYSFKKISSHLALHLSSGTMVTNSYMVNFWAEKGICRADLAKELSFEEIAQIKKKVPIEVQVQIHGATPIFHSKRKLLTDYFKYLNRESTTDISEEYLFLREHERQQERYPVFEDFHGTHIMNDHDICMVEYIDKFIDLGIDSLKIDGVLHSTEYLVKITEIYRSAIDKALNNEDFSESIEQIKALQPLNRPLGTGFYFKEQIY